MVVHGQGPDCPPQAALWAMVSNNRSLKRQMIGLEQAGSVDALRLGATLRAVRIRKGLRQADIARLAAVSTSTISRIERGHIGPVSVGTLSKVARVLELTLDHRVWSRAGDLDRPLNARHAAFVEALLERLGRLGWIARPEVSFNEAGERGFIDILAWRPADRALLVTEVKTEIVDVGELLGTLDRKRRLGPLIGARLGWAPAGEGAVLLVVGESRTNRRRAAMHAATLRAALPDDGRSVPAYLRRPTGQGLAATAFLPYAHRGTLRQQSSAVRRVSRARANVVRAQKPLAGPPGGAGAHEHPAQRSRDGS